MLIINKKNINFLTFILLFWYESSNGIPTCSWKILISEHEVQCLENHLRGINNERDREREWEKERHCDRSTVNKKNLSHERSNAKDQKYAIYYGTPLSYFVPEVNKTLEFQLILIFQYFRLAFFTSLSPMSEYLVLKGRMVKRFAYYSRINDF